MNKSPEHRPGLNSFSTERLSLNLHPGLSLLDHVPCDHQLLDLRRAFVDAEEADGAVEAFHRIFLHVAGAAVDLLTANERNAGSFNGR